VVRRLGSGGMGVVHEAWDTSLERSVALKVISPQLADDPGFRERFTREARAQAALTSEHVVHVYAHGEDDGRLWIATQLIPDGDLGRLLKQYGVPPRPVALDLVDQVAAGLADAHAAGLVHRDIKPANVLLRRGPRIRAYLCDFGIAGPIGAATDDAGTPAYMAPELSAGGSASVASDVYALGCLLRALLPAGDPLDAVARMATAERPEDRYPTASAFREALATSPEPRRPRRRWWLVAVPAAVLVAAGVVYALWPSDDPSSPPGTPGVEQRATDELASSLRSAMSADQADCVAAYLVDDLGFDALVDAGFFDPDGSFLNPDLGDKPEIKQSLTAAALSCA
jgi:serine/threonine protein kinase